MQSRMDKYNSSEISIKSRTQKNQKLYEDVRNNTMTHFNVNSNISVIDNNAKNISVEKVQKILDKRYSDDLPKRKSINIPEYADEPVQESIADTKEYDINAILEKAKSGKNVDYNKERLKKIRETQYEILNNLDLEIKKVEEPLNYKRTKDEENLMNLINTITSLEMENKKKLSKESSEALELLTDLSDDGTTNIQEQHEEPSMPKNENKQDAIKTEAEIRQETIKSEVEELTKQMSEELTKQMSTIQQNSPTQNNMNEQIEKTLTNLNVNSTPSYDEFADISKRDKGSIILKIIILILVIALVFGGVYILDNILELGLF